MIRWLRLLALASVLSIGQGCGLRPVELPRLDPHGQLPVARALASEPAIVAVSPAGVVSAGQRSAPARPAR